MQTVSLSCDGQIIPETFDTGLLLCESCSSKQDRMSERIFSKLTESQHGKKVAVQSTDLTRQVLCIQLGEPITKSRSDFKASKCEWNPGGQLTRLRHR